jgi:hypothetical protein
MFFTVLIGRLSAAWEIFLECRIDDQLFAYCMAREFPGELVLEADLLISISGAHDDVVVFFELSVVLFDRIHKAGHVDCLELTIASSTATPACMLTILFRNRTALKDP